MFYALENSVLYKVMSLPFSRISEQQSCDSTDSIFSGIGAAHFFHI